MARLRPAPRAAPGAATACRRPPPVPPRRQPRACRAAGGAPQSPQPQQPSAAALAAAEAIAAAAEAAAAAELAELAAAPGAGAAAGAAPGAAVAGGSSPARSAAQTTPVGPPPLPVAVVDGGADAELEAAWRAAVEAVSRELGLPAADVARATAQLRLLLPDLDAVLAGLRGAAAPWGAVADALQAAGADLEAQQAAVMALVQQAVSSERDAAEAAQHSRLMLGLSSWFGARRRGDPDAARERCALQAQLDRCAAAATARTDGLMRQQVALAATQAGLPERLIALKSALPEASASLLVVRHPALARQAPAQLAAAAAEARRLLGGELSGGEVVRLLEAAPWLLEPGALAGSLAGLAEAQPGRPPARELLRHATAGGSQLLASFKDQALAAAAAAQ
ncbi:hypothetical protein HT031_003482 [Scenedesmus sp. PABB004]|nr:hypothetical protein HT031_003482 [Scenedesmus sp. PABB004]